MNESTPATSQEEQIHLGAVTITIIATSGCFLLALALWTADYGNFNEFDHRQFLYFEKNYFMNIINGQDFIQNSIT